MQQMRFKSKKVLVFIIAVIIAVSGLAVNVSAITKFPKDYIYSGDKNKKITNNNGHIYLPLTYVVTSSISYVEDENESFSSPNDLFIDSKNNIYVADTGNNRIVKMNKSGKTLAVYYGTDDSEFSEPRGVYIDDNETIYVADSGNNRIVKMKQNGKLVKEYTKPASSLLEEMENEDFIPTKVAVGLNGYIYTLVGKDFMAIDSNNNFKGYIGATSLDFNFVYSLLQKVLTEQQMKKIDKRIPPSYINFTLDNQGRFLACSNASESQIRIINSIGNNIYPSGFYGEVLKVDSDKNDYIRPRFADLTSDKNGIISALDSESGNIYQYDCEGNILTVFGGKGDNMGYFDLPVSIESDDKGNIYVLDSIKQNIQIFKISEFMSKIHLASETYYNGDYDESMKIWQDIEAMCPDYPLARRRIGSIYYKNGDYKKSMEEYSIAEDMNGYSDAFSKYRHEIINDNFALVAFASIGVVVLLFVLVIIAKKHADKVRDKLYLSRLNRK